MWLATLWGIFLAADASPRRHRRDHRALARRAAGAFGYHDFGRIAPLSTAIRAAVTCVIEGTRPLLLEIQALVAPTDLAMPRRVATGVDPKRLAMILAVLSRHAGLPLGSADVFVNVAGGLRIDEPGADLGDRARDRLRGTRRRPSTKASAAFGEIGLTGRLAAGAQAEASSRSAPSSASRRWWRRPAPLPVRRPGASTRRHCEKRFARAKPAKKRASPSNPPKSPEKMALFQAILIPWHRLPVISHVPAGFFDEDDFAEVKDGRGRQACTRLATRWCIPTTGQARS